VIPSTHSFHVHSSAVALFLLQPNAQGRGGTWAPRDLSAEGSSVDVGAGERLIARSCPGEDKSTDSAKAPGPAAMRLSLPDES
jgi:hypothetical protein